MPEKACEILLELQNIGRKSKSYRRLLVSMATARTECAQYDTAETIVQELEPMFSDLGEFDVSDELLHVRILVISARINRSKLRCHDALKICHTALSSLKRYRSFKSEGYTYAVFHLLISDLQVQLNNIAEARRAFDIASSVLGTGMKDFWIPGLASWRQHLEDGIFFKMNWKIRYAS
jgi:hypothetical protein